jgi:hypothetical protein
MRGSPTWALAITMFALVMGFVLSLAWMRPKQAQEEHHPKVDELFDDTGP